MEKSAKVHYMVVSNHLLSTRKQHNISFIPRNGGYVHNEKQETEEWDRTRHMHLSCSSSLFSSLEPNPKLPR
jgi:hypothetical protein